METIVVREMEVQEIYLMVDYFLHLNCEFLKGMGADKNKLPQRQHWIDVLETDFAKSIQQKEYFYVTWLLNGIPVGHSNINKLIYGKLATMHLHLWQTNHRRQGLGCTFVKLSIPVYFKTFKLKKLLCEPFADNLAPNKVLQKVGFNFIKTYETTPGWINFHQSVNQYEFTKAMLVNL